MIPRERASIQTAATLRCPPRMSQSGCPSPRCNERRWRRRATNAKATDGDDSMLAPLGLLALTLLPLPFVCTATNKAPYLDYANALEAGWPIATGIIEGACRHLVKDRMDITGARWDLDGAEAVLKLRALHSNGDFPDYWIFHLGQERRRNHEERYADNALPHAA